MRKTKEQKGITLVALIITIIVLLILAVVAIGAVTNDGIINHAKNARAEYGAAQANESALLANYLEKINANAPGAATGTGTGTGENTGKITFSVLWNEYNADKEQTWESWVIYYSENVEYGAFRVESDGTIYHDGGHVATETNTLVSKNDKIKERS